MPRPLIYAILSAILLLHCAAAHAQSSREDGQVLTNASVIKLVRGGFSEKTVIAIINSRPSRFDLSTERLIELKTRGVGEKIILAMLARQQDATLSDLNWGDDDSFDDDSFFSDPRRPDAKRNAAGGGPGEMNIFGSSGGARGRTRTRGGNGSAEGDTQTIGSATARILRPPTEAGGGALKLERTPTLTNESVVELVAAGFTEGTIIRRIEQSPAEFDLSPDKLAELRRRRVSEPVIAAMRTAMGEGADESDRPRR